VTFKVEVALRMLMGKPVLGNKIGHKNGSGLVTILVIFDRIANFSGPKAAMRILIHTVKPRIYGNLANLVRRSNADTCLVSKDGLYTNTLE
jgi:hypothetical protein